MSFMRITSYAPILFLTLFIFGSCATTPLQKAVYADNAERVKELVKKRKHLDTQRGVHRTPLWVAVSRNNREIVKILVDAGARISDDLCFITNDTGVCKLLIEKGASYQITDKDGNTPLHTIKNADVILYLIGKGLKVDPVSKLGDTPLLMAAGNQEYGKAEVLIKKGADPDYLSPYGNSPRMLATKLKDQKMIGILNAKSE